MHPGWADTAGVRNWMPAFRALTRDDRAVLARPPAASRHLPGRGGSRWWRNPAGTMGPRRRAGRAVI